MCLLLAAGFLAAERANYRDAAGLLPYSTAAPGKAGARQPRPDRHAAGLLEKLAFLG